MQSKTNPTTPAAEAAAEAFVPTYGPNGRTMVDQLRHEAVLHGWSACLQHLSEQGAEFDLPAFDRTFSELESDGYSRYEIAHTIAREQHAQSQAVIQTLKESNRQAISEYSLAHEHVKKYVEQIAALKSELAFKDKSYNEHVERYEAEITALDRKIIGHVDDKSDKDEEIERLRVELAEAQNCKHPGCCCVCGHTGKCPEDGPCTVGGTFE